MTGARRARVGAVGIALALSSGAALAERTPIGGRTATMGGAGVAAGNDSAMPYLNPAGLAGVPGTIFGVSASVHGYQRLDVERYFAPNGVDEELWGEVEVRQDSLESSSFLELPSSVMYFADLGAPPPGMRYKLGLALVIPDATRFEITGAFDMDADLVAGRANEVLSMSYRVIDYQLGPSMAIELSDRLRFGISLFADYQEARRTARGRLDWSINGGVMGVENDHTSATSADALGFAPVAGMQARLMSKLWAGASVAPPTVHVWGRSFETVGTNTIMSAEGLEERSTIEVVFQGPYRKREPLRLNAGLAWEDRDAVSVAVDLTYRAPLAEATRLPEVFRRTESQSGEVTRTYTARDTLRSAVDLEPTLDVAFGVEAAVSRVASLRAGAFTEYSNATPLEETDASYLGIRLDRVGATLGLGLDFTGFDTTLGAVYKHGWGKMGTLDSINTDVDLALVDVRQHSVLLVLSGSVTRDEARGTIADTIGIERLPKFETIRQRGLEYRPPPTRPRSPAVEDGTVGETAPRAASAAKPTAEGATIVEDREVAPVVPETSSSAPRGRAPVEPGSEETGRSAGPGGETPEPPAEDAGEGQP